MIYNYHCKACNKEVEVNIHHSELHNAKCPICDSKDIDRIWNVTPVIYKTDGICGKINKK